MLALAGRFFLFFLVISSARTSNRNNVCKTRLDYATLPINDNCWYDPNVVSTTAEMILRQNYQYEFYNVTTEDGYVLGLFRVLNGRNASDGRTKTPVFILHGLQASSEVWVYLGNRSLAFTLAENGYDVWLGNFRGTPHSRRHVKYTLDDPQYWNYSFHEIGKYDVPANLHFIRNKTGCKAIYVGHSLGTTASYVYASLNGKNAQEYLLGLISLAPIAYMSAIRTPVKALAPSWEIFAAFMEYFKAYAFFPSGPLRMPLRSRLCETFPLILLCEMFIYLLSGSGYGLIQPPAIPLLVSYSTLGGSFKTIVHYGQEVAEDGLFQFYDYGSRNFEIYGTAAPPQYPLEKISVPTHLFCGERDFLSVCEDVQKLYLSLRSEKSLSVLQYNHVAYMASSDLETELYPGMLQKMELLRSLEKCGA